MPYRYYYIHLIKMIILLIDLIYINSKDDVDHDHNDACISNVADGSSG